MDDHDLCWCGSGEEYVSCHKEFDIICEEKRKEGYLIPKKSMIKNFKQIEGIKKAALFNNALLDLIESNIHEGMSTDEIDVLATKFLEENNCTSADYHYEGFPKHLCTSVNDVVCHGIPSKRVILKSGDIVNVDTTLSHKGYYADASRMFVIGNISEKAQKLVRVTKECLIKAENSIKPWETTLNDLGRIIEKHAHKNGFSVVEEYCGHGVGLSMHEDPQVLHYSVNEKTYLLVPGMVITIEPMINQGLKYITLDKNDGWTVKTRDNKLSAQWEHTIVITDTGIEVVSK